MSWVAMVIALMLSMVMEALRTCIGSRSAEKRISLSWCKSGLAACGLAPPPAHRRPQGKEDRGPDGDGRRACHVARDEHGLLRCALAERATRAMQEIGRASCRER